MEVSRKINKSFEERVKEFEKWLNSLSPQLWNKLWFIPIRPNSKLPDVPKGESWLDSKFRLTPGQVAERLKEGKNAAFVATPETLVVVDLDLYDASEDVKQELLNIFPRTLEVRTPHGGIHKYYLPLGNDPIRNADGKGKFKGCGEVRANRKYVLCPGSVVDGQMYKTIPGQLIGLKNDQIPDEFKPNLEEIEMEEEFASNLEREKFEEFKNKYGWSLSDIVIHDFKLWILLSFLHPPEYPSISEADMATMTKLRFWEFEEPVIYDIIRTFRKRDKVLKRKDYLVRTYKKAIPREVISDLVNPQTWNPKFDTIERGIIDRATRLKDPVFDISFLPEDSFIVQYIKSLAEFTDAYPEYHLCAAFSILSIAVDKNIEIMLKPRITYTNVWFLMIGDSTISRKTTCLSLTRDVLSYAGLDTHLLAEDFSPEAFLDELQNIPHVLFMKDEVANFLSMFRKSYGLGIDTLFCALYSNPVRYKRRLRKEIIEIQDPYLNILAAGTLKSIVGLVNEKDIDTGFLPRFLIVAPERRKKRKRIDALDPQLEDKKVELGAWLRKIHMKLRELKEWHGERVKANFTKEALDLFNDYAEEKEDEVFDMDEVDRSRWAAILGRLMENVIKLSVLLKVSERSFLDELENSPISIIIEKKHVEQAITLVEKLFSPYSYKFMLAVECNAEQNFVEKLAAIIQKEGEIERSKALKRSKLRAKEFQEAIDTLRLRRDITIRVVETNGRQREIIYWIGGR